MELFDLVKSTLVQEYGVALEIPLPDFEDTDEASKYLDTAQATYIKYKQYLSLLEQMDKISDVLCEDVHEMFTETDECPVYEDCTMDIVHTLFKHVKVQVKRYKTLCDNVEAWIETEEEFKADYNQYGSLQDDANWTYNNSRI